MLRRNIGIASTASVLGLISILVFAPFATAQSNGRGNPFDAIWEAINDLNATTEDLQEQINNIESAPGPQGPPGSDGQNGEDGADGVDGLNCWDIDGDRVQDPEEDRNGDGSWDALDCQGPEGEQGPPGDSADVSALQGQIDALIEENEDQQDKIDDLLARVAELEAGSGLDADNDSDGFTENEGDCNDANSDIHPGAAELANGIDDDCDDQVDEGTGGGGDPLTTLFVATTGDDANNGTQDAPIRNINTAISRAITLGDIDEIHISEGIYNEQVILADGISLFGGFSADNGWVRDTSLYETTIANSAVSSDDRIIGVSGSNILTETTIDGLTIMTGDALATDFGVSNYALYCSNCDGLTISNNVINAGNGGNGADGADGTPHASPRAPNGNPGADGCEGTNCGFGGAQTFSVEFGGEGGDGGFDSGSGQNGSPGTGNAPVGQGGAGSGCFEGGNDGGNGGSPVNNGANGQPGTGGDGGSVTGGFWTSSSGASGTPGANGKGGSGGGGGGGGDNAGGFCNSDKGGGGGSGGSGGLGGAAGQGGQAGGGSFGVFVIESTGIQLVNNVITCGDGGNGGNGGNGAPGQLGGFGGKGGSGFDDGGAGGDGGNGSNGGDGGAGGGGAGGPSFALFVANTIVDTAGNTLSHGSGGAGGSSLGNDGALGASGITN